MKKNIYSDSPFNYNNSIMSTDTYCGLKFISKIFRVTQKTIKKWEELKVITSIKDGKRSYYNIGRIIQILNYERMDGYNIINQIMDDNRLFLNEYGIVVCDFNKKRK
jgi:hypothetical protein